MSGLVMPRGASGTETGPVTWWSWGECLHCPACALKAAGGRLLPEDGGDLARAMERVAAGQSGFLARAVDGADPHAGCGEATVLPGVLAAYCASRCAVCRRPAGSECAPMIVYRSRAREMHAHMNGFYRGARFVLGEVDAEYAAAVVSGGVPVPDTWFDDRFPSTRFSYEEGFREGAWYALARYGEIGDLDEAVITGSSDSVAYTECAHLDRWATVAESESMARACGFPTADVITRECGVG